MNGSISAAFEQARSEGRAALIAFFAAGDPNLDTTVALVRAAAAGGADIIELGIPFSDPLADGPIIQAAYTRALANGVTVRRIMEMLPELQNDPGLPVVLMTALNPVLAYGAEAFCEDASAAGVAGLLIPDLLPEDAELLREIAQAVGLDTVFLSAPDTSEERLVAAAKASTGFFYLISRRGVTGPAGGVGEGLEAQVARARAVCKVPIAVGFGVTAADDARRVAGVADGVIVGSAFVSEAVNAVDKSREAAAAAVKVKAEELMEGIRKARNETESGGK
jgi:tryptophan synthase alpha chain